MGSAADRRGVGDQPRHQPLAERIVGRRGNEVVMAEPGGDARAGHVRTMRDRVRRRRGDPLADQGAGTQQGRRGADLAQVAQPAEAVCRGGQQRRGGADGPVAGLQHCGGASQLHLAAQQARARGASPGQTSRIGWIGASGRRDIVGRGRRAMNWRTCRSRARGEPQLLRVSARRGATGRPDFAGPVGRGRRAARYVGRRIDNPSGVRLGGCASRGGTQCGDRDGIVGSVEHRGAGDQRVGAGLHRKSCGVWGDAAVNGQRDGMVGCVDYAA